MKCKLLILISLLLLFSCSDSTSEEYQIFVENFIAFKINKSTGENFLEITNTSNTALYYKNNGVLTELVYSQPGAVLDHPKGFIVANDTYTNQKIIKVFCYTGGTNTQEETYIKWNDTDTDTITYNVHRHQNGSIAIDGIRYNNSTISTINQSGLYSVVKN